MDDINAAYEIKGYPNSTLVIWLPWKYRDSLKESYLNLPRLLEDGYDYAFNIKDCEGAYIDSIKINPVKDQLNIFVLEGKTYPINDEGIHVVVK